jgi:hypothetical protein
MSSKSDLLGYFVPTTLLSEIFSNFLSLESIRKFDVAVCSKKKRKFYLECIGSESCIFLGDKHRNFSPRAISWLGSRSIRIRYLKCTRITNDVAIQICSFGSSLHWLSLKFGNIIPVDKSLCKILDGCPNLQSVDLSDCRNITDLSIARLAAVCPYLTSLNVKGSIQITDLGIIKLAFGCPRLHSLNLSQCSISAVGLKCPNLHSLNLRDCEYISDISLLNLKLECPNLHTLNISWNYGITDRGLIKLSEGCPKLHRLHIGHCKFAMSKIEIEELWSDLVVSYNDNDDDEDSNDAQKQCKIS